MGRPPKHRPPPEDGDLPLDPPVRLTGLPPRTLNGVANIEYFRSRFEEVSTQAMEAERRGQPWANYGAHVRAFEMECKLAGIDPDTIMDQRSEMQVFEDALRTLIEGGVPALLEMGDKELDALENGFDAVDSGCADRISELQARAAAEGRKPFSPQQIAEVNKLGKGVCSRVKRVRVLRQRARSPIPPGTEKMMRDGVEAAHSLRFMLYVGRTNEITMGAMGTAVFRIADHHCAMAVALWEAKNGVHIHGGGVQRHVIKYKGCILVTPPRHGKPVHVDEPIAMADGSYKRLGDVAVGDMVIGHSGHPRMVTAVHEQGEIPTVTIKTDHGRSIRACPTHPFLTAGGWKNAGDLVEGDCLAVLSKRSIASTPSTMAACRLAGYFVGDGAVGRSGGGGKSFNAKVTCADDALVEKIRDCANQMGFVVTKRSRATGLASDYEFKSGENAPREWLRRVGMAYKTSSDKRVPDFVFKSSDQGIAEFLAAYFECDGSVNARGKSRKDCCCEFYSINHDLMVDVQRLLARIGVPSRIAEKNGRYKGERHKSWRLSITSSDAVSIFASKVNVVGPKGDRIRDWAPKRTSFDTPYIADAVVSVSASGLGECRCLTVDVDHTFAANDCVVHNSEFGLHSTALEICLRPDDLQALIVHAESSMASGYLQYVAKFFRGDDEKRRRREALFPSLAPSGRDNNQKNLRLAAAETLRDPTLRSNGVHDKRSGANCNWLYLDDPVDQEERKSEASRDDTAERVQNTWMTRMTGERAFLLYCTTLWHENDATCRIIKLAKENKVAFKVLILPAGGPKDNFRPLWPDSPYRESWLRAKYSEDPVFYSLVYMCDPSSEEARMVRKLALFSPTLPGGAPCQSHADFLSDCTSYLSIDPAATTRKESDRCGVVYGAKGFLRSQWKDDAGNEHTRVVRRLRILGAIREKCAPNQIIEAVRAFAKNNPVNAVLMETVGGFAVLADWLRTSESMEVIEFKPGATKLVRLKDSQTMLDDSKRSHGVIPVVEFPGVWEDRDAISCPTHPAADRIIEDGVARCGECRKVYNRLVIDPSVEWLAEEIIRFGQISSDDGLDAVTQLCIYLRDDLGVGETYGKTSVRGFPQRGSNWRMAREMEVFRKSLTPRDCDQDDYTYHIRAYAS